MFEAGWTTVLTLLFTGLALNLGALAMRSTSTSSRLLALGSEDKLGRQRALVQRKQLRGQAGKATHLVGRALWLVSR